jgi:Protein of unknown function (DUF3551)
MRRVSVIAISFVATMLVPWEASAQTSIEYPFCAYGSKSSEGSTRCDFATLAQCQAWLAGGGGSCVPNPRIAQGAQRPQGATPAGRR